MKLMIEKFHGCWRFISVQCKGSTLSIGLAVGFMGHSMLHRDLQSLSHAMHASKTAGALHVAGAMDLLQQLAPG